MECAALISAAQAAAAAALATSERLTDDAAALREQVSTLTADLVVAYTELSRVSVITSQAADVADQVRHPPPNTYRGCP